MNLLSFIYLFSLYVLFVPGIMYKSKHMLLHALLFTIILYFTFDFVYKTRESMNSETNDLQGLVNSLNKEINDKIINANVTNEYNITPESDNSGIVELCKQQISKIEDYKKQIEDLQEKISGYEGTKELIISLNNTINRLNEEQITLENKIKLVNEVISRQENTIEGRNKQISILDETVSDKENVIDFQDTTIDEKSGDIGYLNTNIGLRNSSINKKDIKIGILSDDVTNKEGQIINNKKTITDRDNTIDSQGKYIKYSNKVTLPKQKNLIKDYNGSVEQQRLIMKKQDKSISDLDSSLQKCLEKNTEYVYESVVSFWNFAKEDDNPKDAFSSRNIGLYSGAKIVEGQGLVIPNTNAWAQTAMREETLPGSKTLFAWATVTNNNRSRGGAPISIFQNGTEKFDAIVWAEREQNKWMVGSDHFQRTKHERTPVPTSSINQKQCIVFTQEYTNRNIKIKLFIDGKKVDEYTSATKVTYGSNSWNFLFGPRHLSNRRYNRAGHFIGTIHAAGLINKALSEDEVKQLSSSLDNNKSSLKIPVYNSYYHQIRVDYWLGVMKRNCRTNRVCFYDNYKTLGDFVYDFQGQGISFQFKRGTRASAYDVANNWSHRNPYVSKGLSTVPMKYVKAWT